MIRISKKDLLSMVPKNYPVILLSLVIIQMVGIVYLITATSQQPNSRTLSSIEFADIIRRELKSQQADVNANKLNLTDDNAAIDNVALHEVLRSSIREELAVFFGSTMSNSAGVGIAVSDSAVVDQSLSNVSIPAKPPQMDEAAIEIAMAESNDIIYSAIASGYWSPEDTVAIMSRTAGLPDLQLQQLRKTLFDAMDQQHMDGVIPFL